MIISKTPAPEPLKIKFFILGKKKMKKAREKKYGLNMGGGGYPYLRNSTTKKIYLFCSSFLKGRRFIQTKCKNYSACPEKPFV